MDGRYAFRWLSGDDVDSDDSAGGLSALNCYLGPATWSVALLEISNSFVFLKKTGSIETHKINDSLALLEKLVLGIDLSSH